MVLVHTLTDLPLFETSVEEVYTLLTQVDPFKATGPDGIYASQVIERDGT